MALLCLWNVCAKEGGAWRQFSRRKGKSRLPSVRNPWLFVGNLNESEEEDEEEDDEGDGDEEGGKEEEEEEDKETGSEREEEARLTAPEEPRMERKVPGS